MGSATSAIALVLLGSRGFHSPDPESLESEIRSGDTSLAKDAALVRKLDWPAYLRVFALARRIG